MEQYFELNEGYFGVLYYLIITFFYLRTLIYIQNAYIQLLIKGI